MYVHVTNENDLNLYNKKGLWLVWYYAEWCGHCVAMEENWNKFIEMNNNKSKINIARIEDTMLGRLDNVNIQGFPTIKIYKNGKELEQYSDERTPEKFLKFLKKHEKKQKASKKKLTKKVKSNKKRKLSKKVRKVK